MGDETEVIYCDCPGCIATRRHRRRGFPCMDCGKNTTNSRDWYMLRDEVWKQINPQVDGLLCLDCAERRLGRPLTPQDFTDVPINWHQLALFHVGTL